MPHVAQQFHRAIACNQHIIELCAIGRLDVHEDGTSRSANSPARHDAAAEINRGTAVAAVSYVQPVVSTATIDEIVPVVSGIAIENEDVASGATDKRVVPVGTVDPEPAGAVVGDDVVQFISARLEVRCSPVAERHKILDPRRKYASAI